MLACPNFMNAVCVHKGATSHSKASKLIVSMETLTFSLSIKQLWTLYSNILVPPGSNLPALHFWTLQ